MSTDTRDIQRDLKTIEEELRRLEAEYTKYFTHRRPRPPMDLRQRVEGRIRRWNAMLIPSSADRFRLSTLQARFVTYVRLWDQALRAREEGRPGPFSHLDSPDEPRRPVPGGVERRVGPPDRDAAGGPDPGDEIELEKEK